MGAKVNVQTSEIRVHTPPPLLQISIAAHSPNQPTHQLLRCWLTSDSAA